MSKRKNLKTFNTEKLVNNVVWPITCETTFYFFNKNIADNITTEGKKKYS